MKLFTKLNHELNKRILHADAIGGAFRFECPVNFKRDVLKNYCRHWLNLHISVFGRYVVDAKRFVKIVFGRWMINLPAHHNDAGRGDLHPLFFGNRGTVDVVVFASGSPDHKGNVIGFVGAEKVNRDSIENSRHNMICPTMEDNAEGHKFFSDFRKMFSCGLADVIKVFNCIFAASIRSAKLKLLTMFGKYRGNDSLCWNDLPSSKSFICWRDSGVISNLTFLPVFIGGIIHADNTKSFLSVPLITLAACLYDCHELTPFMANKYNKYNLMSRNIIVCK